MTMNRNEDMKQEWPNKDIEGETRARKAHGEQNTTQDKSLTIGLFEMHLALPEMSARVGSCSERRGEISAVKTEFWPLE